MELKTYLKPLLKWWWLIALAAAVAGVSSYLIQRNDPPIYQSRTSLMVGRPLDSLNPSGSEFYLGQQLAETYAEFARREIVREATMKALGLEFLPEYTIGVPPRTQLLEITVTDIDPVRAQTVANALADQLIQMSPGGMDPEEQERQAFLDRQLADLEKQIQATQDELLVLQTTLGDLFSASEIADTQVQIQALQAKLNTLQANYAGFLASTQEEALNVLTVIEPANLPFDPIGPNKLMTTALAVAFGIILAAGTAYLLEYLDDSLDDADQASRVVGVPLLATLNRARLDDGQGPLVTLDQPRIPLSEAFRDLRTNVQFLGLDGKSSSVLVTSANPNDGKSFTVSNLGIVLAQAGFRTVVVDGDLRRPRQHKYFEVTNQRGLSDLILAVIPLGMPGRREEAQPIDDLLHARIQATRQNGLHLLTSGPIPPNPSELIGSGGMKLILKALQEQYDYVLIDSSPVLAVTDPSILATLSDSVLLVVHAGRTSKKNLVKSRERLEAVRANLRGVVVNRVSTAGGSSYYRYYSEDEPREPGPRSGKRLRLPQAGSSLRQQANRVASTCRTFVADLLQPGKS